MDDMIFKHEAELLSQHSLSLSGSIAGDSSVPFVQYLVTEQVRGGEIDVRGMGYKIVNSGGNDQLKIQKPMGTPEDRKARDLSSPALYILQYISFSPFPLSFYFLCQLFRQLLVLLLYTDTTVFFLEISL